MNLVKALRGELLDCNCCAHSRSECCCDTTWPEEVTREAADQIERLTAELAEKDNHVMLLQHEKGLGILASTEMCKKITALQDLAEHWMIIAEQRRVELAEIRQQLKDNFGYATAEEEKP